ncbi:hypothetical protein ACFWUU_01100 [Kribbella sp. NPDC058693]|uniref:hypothetical protein n=1 Tax=Kribbella sp. NPDC058693 TaxID=3346602 RepID=UPI00364DAF52
MRALRAAVRSDPELSARFDTLVGTEFSRTRRALDDVLMERLLDPLILLTEAYEFDGDKFDDLYKELEPALFAARVKWVDFVPVNGVVLAQGVVVELAPGLILRELSDAEIGAALRVIGIPVERLDTPTSVTVSRFNQVGLTFEHDHPFVAERDLPKQTAPVVVQAIEEPAARLITALRVVCGGSTAATRRLRMLHLDEVEASGSAEAHLTPLGTLDPERPVVLLANDIAELRHVFDFLAQPLPGPLQVALRRLNYAGTRTQAEDRLIDLIICAEALFIHHFGITTHQQSAVIADGAEQLLGGDSVLQVGPGDVNRFMRAAYRRRNSEVHGDVEPAPLLDLHGKPQTELMRVVDDLDRVMRRACRLVLEGS